MSSWGRKAWHCSAICCKGSSYVASIFSSFYSTSGDSSLYFAPSNILKQCRFTTLILRATAASVEWGGVRGRELYNSIILMPQAQFNPWSQSWWTFSQARFIQLYLQKCRRLEKQLPHQIKHIGLLWICLPGRADRSIHPSIIQSFRSYRRSLVEPWAPEDNLFARCSLAPPQS